MSTKSSIGWRRTRPAIFDCNSLRRAAVSVRPGAASHRRAQRFRAQAAVHGRKCSRLAAGAAGPLARLDRRGAQDVQDANGRVLLALLGPGPRHGTDGAGSHEPHAGANSARAAGRPRRHHHGRRIERDAVLSGSLGSRSRKSIRASTHGEAACSTLSTIDGPGFGYRADEIDRPLPEPIYAAGTHSEHGPN